MRKHCALRSGAIVFPRELRTSSSRSGGELADVSAFALPGAIAQVSGTYGREAADTLVENCGNTLILRCSASERGGTSEFASKLIGQREVLQTTESHSKRPNEWLSTRTTSQQVRIEPAVMASEIEQLPDLGGFLKLASASDWKRVRLSPIRYPAVARRRGPEPPSSTLSGAASPANGSGAPTEPSAQAGPGACEGASADPRAPTLVESVGRPPGGAEWPP